MITPSSQVDDAAGAGEPTVPAHADSQFYLQLATGTVVGGSGAGVGKATPQDVVFLARTDIQSPKILAAANTGRHLQTALLSCVRPGELPFTYLTLKFDDVLVTGYQVTPDATDGVPVDLVRLKFAKVTQRFFTQKPDGALAPPVESAFDYKTNTVVVL